MKKIHILTHEFRPKRGGAGVVCEKVAESLSYSGHDVTVWAPEYVDQLKDDYRPAYGIRAIPGLKGTRNVGCLLSLGKALMKERGVLKDSILYLGDPGPIVVFFYLTFLCKPFWKELVITLHGSEIERYQKNGFSNYLFQRLLKRVDRVHVLSSYNRDKVLQWVPSIEKKLVVGYGMMVPGEALPDLSLRKVKPHSARVKLLCVGRIHPRKGQLHLLEAVSRLDTEIQQLLEVQFAGQMVKGWYQNKLSKTAESCHAKITFLGGISDEDLEQSYADADIFALTSMPYQSSVEGLGLVYLEAERYGLPILANRIGGVSDVVQHGKNGYLSDCEDLDQLTANLSILISNPILRKQLGDAGRAMVESCTWKQVTDQIFSD